MPTFTNQSWPAADGTAAQLLRTNGSAVLTWASASSGFSPTYLAKSASYTAVANDVVGCTANTFTVTLPSAVTNANKGIWVVNNGTGSITIGRTGNDTIGLAVTQTLNPATATAQGDSMLFVSDGVSNWVID